MSLQDAFNELNSGCWEHPDPDRCGCNGRGWLISDLDTAHWCSEHGVGVFPWNDEMSDRKFDRHAAKHPGLYEAITAGEMLHAVLKDKPLTGNITVPAKEMFEILNALTMVRMQIDINRERKNDEARAATLNEKLNDPNCPREPELVDAWRERQEILNADTVPMDNSLYKVWRARWTHRQTIYGHGDEGEIFAVGYRPAYFSTENLPRMAHRRVESPNGVYYRNVVKGEEPEFVDPPKPPKTPPLGCDDNDPIPF